MREIRAVRLDAVVVVKVDAWCRELDEIAIAVEAPEDGSELARSQVATGAVGPIRDACVAVVLWARAHRKARRVMPRVPTASGGGGSMMRAMGMMRLQRTKRWRG